jgi:rhodanese-related sulfurtransferase
MQTMTTPYEAARPNRAGYRDVTPEEARAAIGKVRVVDVREPGELASDGFIAGVEHIPMGQVEAACPAWNKDDEIVVICRSGNRSGRVAEMLTRRGFHRVMNMVGGMLAYTAAGLPVARH